MVFKKVLIFAFFCKNPWREVAFNEKSDHTPHSPYKGRPSLRRIARFLFILSHAISLIIKSVSCVLAKKDKQDDDGVTNTTVNKPP